ncbi:DEAD/DEAH box helicase [Paenibacillus agri]|uniref:DEAD/DEAH box helicase n=1 Tax=Paenibacillus agri TaxID=2744309 RepID=A0A850EMZ7_9BACL|nr:DEAD/DEAH box helicase [Paenibacillus agri]NUU61119.1 DEAD/DEAH box helicase [Paenibacillus agri]
MSLFRNRIRGGGGGGPQKPIDPIEIFKTLIHQEGYDYLRDIQSDFLKLWHSKRVDRDVVGILNTGAGKTLIGQLMLLSKMNEGVGTVVYLCPDTQLVDQAVEQAAIHNIPVVTIDSEPGQAAEFPVDFLNKKAILITTFERMFNGRSIFGVDGYGSRPIQEIGALVIDDAHSCIKKARQQSTILIEKKHPAYSQLFKLFEASIREQGEGALTSIKSGSSTVSRLVPYWVWRQHKDAILNILQKLHQDDDATVFFNWGIVGDELSKSQCYISGTQIEITPLQIPVQRIPSFFNAKHRFIMSATFNNNTDLITELGIEKSSVVTPLEVDNQGDAGERLIIAPKRYYADLTDEIMRPVIAKYAEKHNVVVIVPNSQKAKVWKKYNPTIVDKDNILTATRTLRESKGNLMVFLNRYDGVDLAGDSCRILVLDGKPSTATTRERYISIVREGSPFLLAQTAQTIEQGLGRAVRSGSDHCAVFILDNSLLSFIGIDANQAFFNPSTRAQIDFGLNLFGDHKPNSSEEALNEISAAVEDCLKGDPEWRQFHKDMILNAEPDDKSATSYLLDIAETERVALVKYHDEDYEEACGTISDIINTHKAAMSIIDEAYYLQMGATLLDSINPVGASDMQVKARKLSSKVLKTQAHTYSKLTKVKGKQADIIVKWLSQYSNATDVIIAIEHLYADLIYSPDVDSHAFERAVHQIGDFLGFTSQMPEEDEGDGPDNLWRLEDGVNLIIEAKNNSINDKISRKEVEQLLHSIQWHNDKYGTEQKFIPIMLHRATKSLDNTHPSDDSRVMNEALLKQFKDALLNFAKALSQKPPLYWKVAEVHNLLSTYNLLYNQIVDKFTVPLR